MTGGIYQNRRARYGSAAVMSEIDHRPDRDQRSSRRPARMIRPPRWRRPAAVLFKLALVGVALFLAWRLLATVGWPELVHRAAGISPALLAAAALCLLARFVFMYLRWRHPLRLLDIRISDPFGFATLLAAILVNHLTPTARLLGGVVRARYVNQHYGTGFSNGYGTVLVDQVSHQIVHGMLTWVALALLSWILGWRGVATLLLLLLGATLLGVLWWQRRPRGSRTAGAGRLLRRYADRQAHRLGPLYTGGQQVAALFRRGFSNRQMQLWMAIWGVSILLVNALAQWLVFKGLQVDVGYLRVLVTVAVGVGAGIVSGTPGGVATTEASMVAVFVALGMPEIDAAAGTLVYRGLHYLVVLGLGLPSLLWCEFSSRSLKREAVPDPAAQPGSDATP